MKASFRLASFSRLMVAGAVNITVLEKIYYIQAQGVNEAIYIYIYEFE